MSKVPSMECQCCCSVSAGSAGEAEMASNRHRASSIQHHSFCRFSAPFVDSIWLGTSGVLTHYSARVERVKYCVISGFFGVLEKLPLWLHLTPTRLAIGPILPQMPEEWRVLLTVRRCFVSTWRTSPSPV